MRLRILSYNIHKCIGGVDRRYQPERVQGVISHYQPDIVLLQEVDEGVARSNHHRQVDLLGNLLGFAHRTYFSNVEVRGGGKYGNAILSRFPIRTTSNIDLTIPLKKRRSALHASVRLRSSYGTKIRTLHIYNLHLGLAGVERGLQLKRFLKSHPFAHLHHRTPIIVAGDFNDVWGTLGSRFLVPAGFRGLEDPIPTFPAYAPIRALDSVYVRGDISILRSRCSQLNLAKEASDHLPMIVDLRLT